MTLMLLRAAFVALMLLMAQPSWPLVLLALYFYLQGEALAHGYRQERDRLTMLLTCMEDVEDDEDASLVQEIEDEAIGYALFQRWPEQRH